VSYCVRRDGNFAPQIGSILLLEIALHSNPPFAMVNKNVEHRTKTLLIIQEAPHINYVRSNWGNPDSAIDVNGVLRRNDLNAHAGRGIEVGGNISMSKGKGKTGRRKAYRIVQPALWSLLVLTCNATRAASVKASFTPRFFIAEHSGFQISKH
jgi:hypothetical protein